MGWRFARETAMFGGGTQEGGVKPPLQMRSLVGRLVATTRWLGSFGDPCRIASGRQASRWREARRVGCPERGTQDPPATTVGGAPETQEGGVKLRVREWEKPKSTARNHLANCARWRRVGCATSDGKNWRWISGGLEHRPGVLGGRVVCAGVEMACSD